ncbi:MAG: hypothetical protein HZC11_08000 [Nitrospirae bacterium]|nr:hypothetical protein [Nitrospirota bacterium]
MFLGLGGGFLSGLLGLDRRTNYLRLAIAIIIAITGLRMWYQVVTEN